MTTNSREIYRKKTQEMYNTLMLKQKLKERALRKEKYTQVRMGKLICALGLQHEDPLVLLGLLSKSRAQLEQLDDQKKEMIGKEGRSLWDELKAQNQNQIAEEDLSS